ncbi:MAG: CRISPR-associated helicase/endonuclease Cas3 [Isosphaeraceae bacterium]
MYRTRSLTGASSALWGGRTLDYYAHTGRDGFPSRSDWQRLRSHLTAVARLAETHARNAVGDRDSWLINAAGVAGLFHDLGKYRHGFQHYLNGAPVAAEARYHKQAGAAKAAEARLWPVAFAIAGHHGGLPDSAALKEAIAGAAGGPAAKEIWRDATADCPELLAVASAAPPADGHRLYLELLTRVLFSCLVDADWADTAEHERTWRGWEPDPNPPPLDPTCRLKMVRGEVDRKVKAAQGSEGSAGTSPEVAKARDAVYRACLDAAVGPTGLYSLTVPTGGGKTLSGLAFALAHAARHGLRRIIYVAPYLSILDQNAQAIREALGLDDDDLAVFEHHGLTDPVARRGDDDLDETRREAASRRAENWDAPIVLTTNVMFFESLFSNQPRRCRKLHNVARSVILLDECQTLPPGLVAPTCSMLKALTNTLGSTVVLATATQPAFDHPSMRRDVALNDVKEIAPPLFDSLERVRVEWPGLDQTMDWPEVAARMGWDRSLCIVNTKRAASELFATLKGAVGKGVFHLSTSMCPAHRMETLTEIRRRLDKGERCLVVSTQLIEAGVDIDFPVVLRELAPLEAIIQAAGRCNSKGNLKGLDGGPGGKVIVFRSHASVGEDARRYYPADPWYRAGRDVLQTAFLNKGRPPRINAPADMSEYYERLYHHGDLDANRIQDARARCDFPKVASAYRLIDDSGFAVVVADWDGHESEVADLLRAFDGPVPRRSAYRKLAPFQVNLRGRPEMTPGVIEEQPGVFVWRGRYDPEIGFEPGDDPDRWVV